MTYRVLATTGVRIFPLALGTLNFNKDTPDRHEESKRILEIALDYGINLIDTADSYGNGTSEEIIGEVITGAKRDKVFLATKFYRKRGDDLNDQGSSRRWIVREVERSLRRLRTDHIDLYQAHRHDPLTDIGETLETLTDLVRAGKIRYFGTSTVSPDELVEYQLRARLGHTYRPVSEQPPYSLLVRGVERYLLPAAQRHQVGVIPWSPLAAGWLAGKLPDDAGADWSQRLAKTPARTDISGSANVEKVRAVRELTELARDIGVTLPHLAVAFVLEHPAVTAALVGPRTAAHLEAALGAEKVELSAEILDRIDRIVPPGTTFNPTDDGQQPLSITDPRLRRRSQFPLPDDTFGR